MTKDIDFTCVGNLIRTLREDEKLTQDDLAKALNVTKAAISQWENGSGIKTEKICEIAEYFNISVKELIDGKLNSESETDYFVRNFNLEHHADFSILDDKNIDELCNYLQCCKNLISAINKRFPKYLNNELDTRKRTEFSRMLMFFNVDDDCIRYISEYISWKEFVEGILNQDDMTNEEKDYELSKVFELRLDVKPFDVLDYGDEASINLLLDVLNLRQRDNLLTNYVYKNKLTDDQIENSVSIKIMINRGIKVLYTREYLNPNLYYDKECLDGIDGTIETDLEKTEASEMLSYCKHPSDDEMYYACVVNNKNLFISGYKKIINEKETDRIANIVSYKNGDPIKYHKLQLNR